MNRREGSLLIAAAIGGGIMLSKHCRTARQPVATGAPLWAGANCRVRAQINGHHVTRAAYDHYLIHRIRVVERKLGLSPMAPGPAATMLARLTNEKLALGPAAIEACLAAQVRLADRGTNRLLALAGKRVVTSETRIDVDGLALTDFLTFFDWVQARNSAAIERINLGAHPDHYVFRALPGDFLEVIEACGSSPLPTRMFIRYHPTVAIAVNQEQGAAQWRRGTAQLQSGRIQGGVRHQFTPTANGFRAALRCDFPATTPRALVRHHQMHLACEFTGWVKALATG